MRKLIYIVNFFLAVACTLVVTTTQPTVNKIDTYKNISYINSEEFKQSNVNRQSDVVEETKEPEEASVEEEEVKEEIVEDEKIETDVRDQEESTTTSQENITEPVITTGNEVFVSSMSGYGADIGDYTAYGYCIKDKITFVDNEYQEVRILSGGSEYPFGTIVKVTGSAVGDFIGIVLDRGPNIGKDKKFAFDLLFNTSAEALSYGVSNNVTFEILRVGF